MSTKLAPLSLAATLLAGTAMADVPSVAVDIAPVHSLVARVMAGVGEPNLILPAGASPHEYSLRPSDASALQEADIVVWMGSDLTPWMEDAIATLATDAQVTTLLEAEETTLLDFREGALFETHDHDDDDHDDHDDHGGDHDDHGAEEAAADGHHDDDHGHAEDAKADDHDDHGHEDHADAEQGHDDHDHGDHDPHAWLAPSNASAWLNLIAAKLSAADPDNAGAYFANAAAGQAELERLAEDVRTLLAPVESGSFIVFHDAYQYFETDFDVTAAGAISLGDAAEPSPARITEIQARVQETGVTCILSEPQYNANLVSTVLDGTEAGTGVIDPLGVTMELGPELYPQLIRNMATTLANCG